MKFFNGITVFFYTAFFVIIGLFLVGASVEFISKDDLLRMIEYVSYAPNLRLITGVSGVLIILISISLLKLAIGRVQKHKNIAFDNPDGQVSISLFAIEDFIKRTGDQVEDLKELRSDVVANKKGVEVSIKVVLWSDINIPEAIERLQGLVKSKIQGMLGIDDPITIRVHVTKIAQREPSKKKKHGEKKEFAETDETGAIPYRGIEYKVD